MQDGLYNLNLKFIAGPGGSQPIGNPFAQPNAMERLEKDPQTREFMKDPLFRQQIMFMSQSGTLQYVVQLLLWQFLLSL